jgi:murein DD-endopeptidase MepM/ murein hydrolase activator NlpD
VTGRAVLVVFLVVIVAAAGGFSWLRCEGGPPEIRGPAEIDLGRTAQTVELSASDAGSGVRHVAARLRHAEGEQELKVADAPGSWLRGGVPGEPAKLEVALDTAALQLKDGDAFLVVEARDWSWRDLFAGNVSQLEIPVRVDTKPPRVSVESGLTYLRRAGSGAVIYRVSEDSARDGVRVGDREYRGFPRKGGAATERIALFGIARDQTPGVSIEVFAEDRAGNRARAGWATNLADTAFAETPIELGGQFMDKKIPELADELGYDRTDLLAAFQRINTEERAKDEARIREIVRQSGAERLFDGPFAQMRNSQVTSRFAEHRTYFYQGKAVSEAIHYGYDLASTAGAPVEAANRGRVLHAGPLGIYGNAVVLDHGLGLTSLYGHLAQIDVEPGQLVEKGARLGRSGRTGLAGGDHLHFAILVGETYVDPVEWWDAKWVREHVDVAPAAPTPEAAAVPSAG